MTTRARRIGLIGAGGISSSHLPHLLTLGADVVVYADEGADALTARFGGSVATSLDELLSSVDWVDVVTPTPTHFDIVRLALHAGKHVICEKPIARTAEQAAELENIALRAGLELRPAHVVRFFPEYVRLHEAVATGRLGKLAVARFYRSGAHPTSPWYSQERDSGGIILDLMIHDLDAARWVAGSVVQVSASHVRREGEAPIEAAHVLLTHESGAISHVAGVWGPPHLRFTNGFTVTGTEGQLHHDSASESLFATDLGAAEGAGAAAPTVGAGVDDPYFLELQEFLGDGPQRVTPSDAVEAVRIANAAIESATTGQPVDLSGRSRR